MAKLLKLRRGTTTQHGSFTGAEGEVTVDTDKDSLVVHNGSTAGGFPIARSPATAGTVGTSEVVQVDANKDASGFRNITATGELDAATLDISGDADIDGTLEADAITVNGTALNTVIAGVTVTNATTAATGTEVTVSANNSTDETVYPVFVDGATGAQGIESDTGLTYNPSSGLLTSTSFAGNLTGNVTGNTSGTAATVTTAAQTSITSLGTLTGLTVAGGEGASGVIGLYADEGDDNADKFQWLVDTSGVMKWQAYSGGSWQDELTLSNAGNLVATGNVTAYSDARLKTDVDTIENALDKVTKLRGVSYTKIDTDERGIGVIAQEIEEVIPEVVQDGAFKSVAYGNIVGVLIEAIKELKSEIDELKGGN